MSDLVFHFLLSFIDFFHFVSSSFRFFFRVFNIFFFNFSKFFLPPYKVNSFLPCLLSWLLPSALYVLAFPSSLLTFSPFLNIAFLSFSPSSFLSSPSFPRLYYTCPFSLLPSFLLPSQPFFYLPSSFFPSLSPSFYLNFSYISSPSPYSFPAASITTIARSLSVSLAEIKKTKQTR